MQRRTFIKATAAGGLLIGTGGYLWLRAGAGDTLLSIDDSLRRLNALEGGDVSSVGEWGAGKIFAHCAQSVEFSMSGFMNHKSALFKSTVGKAALAVFATKGRMSHSLSEPIPGAPALPDDENVHAALTRLKSALIAFRDYAGELRPHFAYGALSKADYTLAHVLHLNNHMTQIRLGSRPQD